MLAIDPGTTESAFVVLGSGRTILMHGKMPNGQLLEQIADLCRSGASACSIEMIASYGMAVGREVFETCLWVGRFMDRALPICGEVRLLYRAEVKSHLCHSQKAKDGNIRQALIDRLGAPGTKKAPGPTYGISGDRWAALAVAVTAFETEAKLENLRR